MKRVLIIGGMVGLGAPAAWAHGDHPHIHVHDALAHHAGQWDVWLLTAALGIVAVGLVIRVALAWGRRGQAAQACRVERRGLGRG